MGGDYMAFGDLVLNGDGAIGPVSAAMYTVRRTHGLGGLPTPRLVLTQLAGVPGAILSETNDDYRVVVLDGEIYAHSHELLERELERFKFHLSQQRGSQYFYWTPENGTARRIGAVLQNNADAVLDVEEGDTTAPFRLELLCASPYFQTVTETVVSGGLTASGQTLEITNLGTAWVEPVIRLKPTVATGGGYGYRCWVPLYNRHSVALTNYPIEITSEAGTGFDHAALVTASKAQADGDDLRVYVDGVEKARWLSGANTSTCKVWANFTLQPAVYSTLSTAFLSGGDVEDLYLADVTNFPSSGLLVNRDTGEAFTYTGKDGAQNCLTGVTRAAKNTTAAAGTVGDSFYWVEKEVWLLYGHPTVSAPTVDDNYKPAFNLSTSTNTSWDYDDFGEDDGLPTAAWVSQIVNSDVTFYGGNHAGSADPWVELGIMPDMMGGYGRRYLYNPCGIVTANFQNGEKFATPLSAWSTAVVEKSSNGSSWTTLYAIPAPTSATTWESWSQSVSPSALYVGIQFGTIASNTMLALEASDVTVTLDSSNTPAAGLGAEQGSYSLDTTLTLVVDGADAEALRLQLAMSLNQELEIDCAERTVTLLADNSNQYQALTLQGTPLLRNYWLRLPGHWNGGETVSLRVDETGLAGMTVAVVFRDAWL